MSPETIGLIVWLVGIGVGLFLFAWLMEDPWREPWIMLVLVWPVTLTVVPLLAPFWGAYAVGRWLHRRRILRATPPEAPHD